MAESFFDPRNLHRARALLEAPARGESVGSILAAAAAFAASALALVIVVISLPSPWPT
jgi:hypothetical protein